MKLSHLHVAVRDLPAALVWFHQVGGVEAALVNDRMASLSLGGISLILDAANDDGEVTLALDSMDCQRDFAAFVARGALALEAPADQAWGVRAAYIKGPAGLTIEIEQQLA
jgi:catechol 2,3-dioxygenase-like lactoylglutathione lyase family enzyme